MAGYRTGKECTLTAGVISRQAMSSIPSLISTRSLISPAATGFASTSEAIGGALVWGIGAIS